MKIYLICFGGYSSRRFSFYFILNLCIKAAKFPTFTYFFFFLIHLFMRSVGRCDVASSLTIPFVALLLLLGFFLCARCVSPHFVWKTFIFIVMCTKKMVNRLKTNEKDGDRKSKQLSDLLQFNGTESHLTSESTLFKFCVLCYNASSAETNQKLFSVAVCTLISVCSFYRITGNYSIPLFHPYLFPLCCCNPAFYSSLLLFGTKRA